MKVEDIKIKMSSNPMVELQWIENQIKGTYNKLNNIEYSLRKILGDNDLKYVEKRLDGIHKDEGFLKVERMHHDIAYLQAKTYDLLQDWMNFVHNLEDWEKYKYYC